LVVRTTWSVPQETKPAPRPLLLVQAFVNTWDGDLGTDAFLHPEPACDWLAAAGLWNGPGTPEPGELHVARSVREGIRALLAANGGGPAPVPGDLRPLEALMQSSPLRMKTQPDGRISLDPEPGGGRLETQLATLLLLIRDAQQEGTWGRLKACRNPECRWAFYDRSHSQRGTWCDMAVCGNRVKNRRLRQRNA
jgi:predicted RNA-binding Zn ribbon-like protein